MQRIANGTQVASMPTPAAPVGTPGYGTSGDPGAGLLGSIFGADDFNRHQEELMSWLAAAGITPDGNNNAQVLEAAHKIFGGGGTMGGNGWQYLPDGMLLQWGSGATVTGGVAVTFPISFGASPPIVLLSESGAGSWVPASNWTIYGRNSVAAGSMFVNSVTWNGTGFVNGNGNFNWLALGVA
ncbi:hypothetical protein EJV46_16120 [Roseococcus sp. SYP-B2431]|uniref:gp53-like domain-containing protein n=1 Tax=Roseococcus sp. SYP-B2431 TaxID=2496640 RepID=UPI00103A135C|nr:hypothetical protein [Roseococcus sp. SYP-B2431]TCH97642.1 hypothetical protein EJV46_16120 [Roseococcus sp. SYP-B2431]